MTSSPKRRLLLMLPLLAALVVLWGVLTNGLPRGLLAARVLGGPSLGGTRCAWRVLTTRIEGGRGAPLAGVELRVTARTGGEQRSWTGTSDASGLAEARLEFTAPLSAEPWLRIEELSSGMLLAEGPADVDAARWRGAAHRRGGWLPGRTSGRLALRVALRDGVLAVPFPGRLRVEASVVTGAWEERSRTVAGVELTVELDGAELDGPARSAVERVWTDANGSAEFGVQPLEHAVQLHLTAHAAQGEPSGALGEWQGSLPVLPGALLAELENGELRVRSPVARERAYVSFVTLQRRLGGGSVQLVPDSSGGSSGSLHLEPGLRELIQAQPSFAVVSSEYDERSPSAVGWPLVSESGAARQTFDVPEQILLDGREQALAAERLGRQRRRIWMGTWLAVIGGALLALFWSEARARKRPRAAALVDRTTNGIELALEPQRWTLVLALSCIALGLLALAYFGSNPP
jgi:hypothetical protein